MLNGEKERGLSLVGGKDSKEKKEERKSSAPKETGREEEGPRGGSLYTS